MGAETTSGELRQAHTLLLIQHWRSADQGAGRSFTRVMQGEHKAHIGCEGTISVEVEQVGDPRSPGDRRHETGEAPLGCVGHAVYTVFSTLPLSGWPSHFCSGEGRSICSFTNGCPDRSMHRQPTPLPFSGANATPLQTCLARPRAIVQNSDGHPH